MPLSDLAPAVAPIIPITTTAASAPPTVPGRRSVVRIMVELNCLLCGRPQGNLEAEAWPPRGPVLLRLMDGRASRLIRGWQHLRCAVCGGSVVTGDLTRRRVWLEVVDWTAERPRRGRPPKALVARRLAGEADLKGASPWATCP